MQTFMCAYNSSMQQQKKGGNGKGKEKQKQKCKKHRPKKGMIAQFNSLCKRVLTSSSLFSSMCEHNAVSFRIKQQGDLGRMIIK